MAAAVNNLNVFVGCSAQEAVTLGCYACFTTLFCGRSGFTTLPLVSSQLTDVTSVSICLSFADSSIAQQVFVEYLDPGNSNDPAEMPHYQEKKKKRKEKTAPFGVISMRSPVLYRAAQFNIRTVAQYCHVQSKS